MATAQAVLRGYQEATGKALDGFEGMFDFDTQTTDNGAVDFESETTNFDGEDTKSHDDLWHHDSTYMYVIAGRKKIHKHTRYCLTFNCTFLHIFWITDTRDSQ